MDWLLFRQNVDVHAALDALPLQEFLVVWLYIYEGQSYAEIAALIGVSKTTAHKLHSRALDRLRADAGHVLGVSFGDDVVRVDASPVVAEVTSVLTGIETATEYSLADVPVCPQHPLLPELRTTHDAVPVGVPGPRPLNAVGRTVADQ